MDPRLIDAIRRGVTVVVPQAHAARQLRARYARWVAMAAGDGSAAPAGAGAASVGAPAHPMGTATRPLGAIGGAPGPAPVWHTPDIVSWPGYLSRLQEQLLWSGGLGDAGEFVDAWRAELLWEQVLADEPSVVTAVSSLARLARQAWETLGAYEAQRLLLDNDRAFGAQAERLARWARRYVALLREARCVDATGARHALVRGLQRAELSGQELLLFGFDRLTPADRTLLRTLIGRGVRLRACRAALARRPGAVAPVHRPFVDEEAQLRALGTWVRGVLRERPGGAVLVAPAQRVTAGTPAARQIARALDDALVPVALLPSMADLPRPWRFALQGNVADQALCRSAIAWLALTGTRIDADAFSSLMHDAGVSLEAAEQSARALFDVWLRQHGWVQVAVRELPGLLRRYGRRGRRPHRLERALEAADAALACADRASADDWVRRFRTLLAAVAWPRPPETPEEQQAVDEFGVALARLADAAPLLGTMSGEEALRRLVRLLGAVTLRADHADPAVLVAPLEAAMAMDVDALWLLDLDAAQWPPAPRVHPLIGTPLARQVGLAEASAAGQRARAEFLLRRAVRAAPTVVVSSATLHGEQRVPPSPLLAAAGVATATVVEAGAVGPGGPRLPVTRTALECLHDDQGPPLASTDADRRAADGSSTDPGVAVEPVTRGGAGVLAHQAECPFRAFAAVRLDAVGLPDPMRCARQRRGVLLHAALASLWTDIGGRDALRRRLTAGTLPGQIAAALAAARAHEEGRGHAPLAPALAAVEARSLGATLLDWLRLEAAREDFRVVAVEQQHAVAIGGLRLTVRVDRLDESAAGQRLVIDYKSGAEAAAGGWRGARPHAPQLPLYAVTLEPPPQAVAFALLARGAQRFSGLAAADGLLPGVPGVAGTADGADPADGAARDDPWRARLARWREVLAALAGEFGAGHAPVRPHRGMTTCQFCELSSLCRIPRAPGDDPAPAASSASAARPGRSRAADDAGPAGGRP